MKKELLFTFSALIATTSCNIKKTDSEQIAGKKPMNIIYIMSDDHSYQTISAYDKRFIQTPNIDRLANEGVRFTNSFVANSISGPSRACILTGKHSHANGFTDNSSTFDGSQQTYPKLLQKAGYETAIIGKWHLTSAPTGFDYSEILIGQGIYYNAPFIKNGKQVPSIIRKTKCFDFWERNVLFPKTKRSFFRTPKHPLPCPFPLNFSLLIITKKFGNLAKNRYICIV